MSRAVFRSGWPIVGQGLGFVAGARYWRRYDGPVKKVLGAFVLLMGLSVGGFVLYNFAVEMLPSARGKSPVVPILFSLGAVYVGQKWIREG